METEHITTNGHSTVDDNQPTEESTQDKQNTDSVRK